MDDVDISLAVSPRIGQGLRVNDFADIVVTVINRIGVSPPSFKSTVSPSR